MTNMVEKLETALNQLDCLNNLQHLTVDSSSLYAIKSLCLYLTELMMAKDKYTIFCTNSDEFVHDLLKGYEVGYANLDFPELIREFCGQEFVYSPDHFVDCVYKLIKAHYWQEESYPQHSAETLIQETIYHFAELVHNVYLLIKNYEH